MQCTFLRKNSANSENTIYLRCSIYDDTHAPSRKIHFKCIVRCYSHGVTRNPHDMLTIYFVDINAILSNGSMHATRHLRDTIHWQHVCWRHFWSVTGWHLSREILWFLISYTQIWNSHWNKHIVRPKLFTTINNPRFLFCMDAANVSFVIDRLNKKILFFSERESSSVFLPLHVMLMSCITVRIAP